MIGVRGYLSGCILALAACIGLAVPVLAQDNSGLAAGKEAWARASCSNCHGSMAQGGDGGDYPVGPSLRNITYDKETMVGIVSCGIPGTPPMPAWLKGAYTKDECYGMPLGSIPAGMTVPAILTADEIKALVDSLRKHYHDELDTGQVKASAKEPRACSARRLVMGRSQFSARAPTGQFRGTTQADGLK